MAAWKGSVDLAEGQTAELQPLLKAGNAATEVTVADNATPLVTTNSPTLPATAEAGPLSIREGVQ
jgi:hypothetical protein